jgi:hypothetical protein
MLLVVPPHLYWGLCGSEYSGDSSTRTNSKAYIPLKTME